MATAILPAPANNGQPPAYPIDEEAVLRHLKLNPREVATQALLLACRRYGLDPLLKHAVLIQGQLYVTRDGLLYVAHRSGQLDGLVVEDQGETPTHWTAKVAAYRKDMGRPFAYVGRYPKSGHMKAYGPEMAVKVAEVMALRRAFNIGICAREEIWDQEEPGPAEAPMGAYEGDPPPRTYRPPARGEGTPAEVRDYTAWSIGYVKKVNDAWHARHGGEGLKDLLRPAQLMGHLYLACVEGAGRGDGITYTHRERHVANAFAADRERVVAKAQEYVRSLADDAEAEREGRTAEEGPQELPDEPGMHG